MPMNPRTRLIYDTPAFKGYEVVLDLYEDVICYGILLVPTDIKPGEKRPVVVCQHGLEGRPTDVCDPKTKTNATIPSAPTWPDKATSSSHRRTRTSSEHVSPTGPQRAIRSSLSLYSFIVRQHERILDFLATLPFVDREQDRLLRPVLRRQGGHAHPGIAGRATACRSAPAISTNGSGRTSRSTGPAATCSPANTKCTSSTWATPSTTPRWPP